jgi:hypothetical protein
MPPVINRTKKTWPKEVNLQVDTSTGLLMTGKWLCFLMKAILSFISETGAANAGGQELRTALPHHQDGRQRVSEKAGRKHAQEAVPMSHVIKREGVTSKY